MKVAWISALSVSVALASAAFAAEAEAPKAATDWLGLVDRGEYGQSWSVSGALFHARVSQAEWTAKVAPVRQPLGPVQSRRLTSEQQTTSLPGAPDGHYAVVQFSTSFANKRGAIETVILAQEPSGWTVDGYFVR